MRLPLAVRLCRCGCGAQVTNEMQECFPVMPWDAAGLPPRSAGARCARHQHCAYRDDDPAWCSRCHGVSAQCLC